ncbi:uncharacterized protein [Lolium perenne]|jgi:hypothetical protein|uniref:uncharacterized protein n=1 Tax=Lolium perenne TaxID=4522 RepID=UPI0021EAEF5B|nr:uncharacterized protein LOC127312418 [Lolium perenne]
MSSMKPIVVFLVHLAFTFATRCRLLEASCQAPSFTVEAACRAAAGTEYMYELCRDAMRDMSAPENQVSLYALVAAKRALASYGDTVQALAGMLRNASHQDERKAYMLCADRYRDSGDTMRGVADELNGCRFAGLGQRYRDGIAQLESCRDRLFKAMSSPLYAMNLLDRNKAILAYFVGRLLAGVDP